MPPKAAVARAPSPSPSLPLPVHNDANDILIIQDLMDTIDQIPIELTRVHSDLNELGAVLYSTLCNLERKLHQLIDWVQSPHIDPAQRFQLLQEIAEEAARYKLGGDDKIRVAGGACDGIMGHQRHISDLLAASTLLERDPPSPYTASLILPAAPVTVSTRRGGRTTGSPFVDRGTPTKRKKNRKEAVGKDDDDASSINGEKKKVPQKRKKPRGVSPSESVASNSYGKPSEPVARTARQIAAAAAKAKAAARMAADDSDEESVDDEQPRRGSKAMQPTVSNDSLAPSGALGIDVGTSREGSAGKAGASGNGTVKARGRKRPHGEDDDDDEDDEDDGPGPPKRNSAGTKKYDEADAADDMGGDQNEVDSKVYCTCRQFSYGEMIGCDDDDCEIEWYHVACLGLDKPPEGTWICPQCLERRKRNPKAKKSSKSSKRR